MKVFYILLLHFVSYLTVAQGWQATPPVRSAYLSLPQKVKMIIGYDQENDTSSVKTYTENGFLQSEISFS